MSYSLSTTPTVQREDHFPFLLQEQPVLPFLEKKTNLVDVFLSRTYSHDPKGAKVSFQELIFQSGGSSYGYDVLSLMALHIARGPAYPSTPDHSFEFTQDFTSGGKNNPVAFAFISHEKEALHIAEITGSLANVKGYYFPYFNMIFFERSSSFLHEATHACMHYIFDNTALPYPKEGGKIKEAFDEAIYDILQKIAIEFSIPISDQGKPYSASEIKEALLKNKILELFTCTLYPDLLKNNPAKKQEIKDIFFEGKDVSNLETVLYNVFAKSLKAFNMNEDEMQVLINITYFLFNTQAKYDYFDREIIVKLPQFAYEGVDQKILHKYFGKLEEFWKEYIRPSVEEIHAAHIHSFMYGIENNNFHFEHHIEELTDLYKTQMTPMETQIMHTDFNITA